MKTHDKTEVVIYVRGGVVQSVLSSTPNINVKVIDGDDDPDNADLKLELAQKECPNTIY